MEAGSKPTLSEPRDWGTSHELSDAILGDCVFGFFEPFQIVPLMALSENSPPCRKQCFTALFGNPATPDYCWGQETSTLKVKGLSPQVMSLAEYLSAAHKAVVLNPCTLCVLGLAQVTTQHLTTRAAGKGSGLFPL